MPTLTTPPSLRHRDELGAGDAAIDDLLFAVLRERGVEWDVASYGAAVGATALRWHAGDLDDVVGRLALGREELAQLMERGIDYLKAAELLGFETGPWAEAADVRWARIAA